MKRMHKNGFEKVRDLMFEYPYFDDHLRKLGDDDAEVAIKIIYTKDAIKGCLDNELDENLKRFIECYYFKRYSMNKSLNEAHYSWSSIKRKRKAFFKKVAQELSIYWE
ncbi:hypothetical protein IW492_05840 [Enterococcus sp. BWB1-3]|uniref:hypothetical protein n=1 Tax=Enterococcus sp. BWB1-3 TaxID=2787713 RepID=UPI001922A595|nr:hypothetical protein [Enterococcus sp. BWB1-3]MBL1228753.1 hypothetical protein [Enterococcus sp. BWB1-3]